MTEQATIRLKANFMKEKIIVDLKYSGLNNDMICFLRLILNNQKGDGQIISKENEIRVLQAIAETCRNELKAFPTSLEEDRDIYNKVSSLDYKMRFIVLYRIGRKRILARQIEMAEEIAKSLSQCGKGLDSLPSCQSPSMVSYISSLKSLC